MNFYFLSKNNKSSHLTFKITIMCRSIRNFTIPPGKPRAFDHHSCARGVGNHGNLKRPVLKSLNTQGGGGCPGDVDVSHRISSQNPTRRTLASTYLFHDHILQSHLFNIIPHGIYCILEKSRMEYAKKL